MLYDLFNEPVKTMIYMQKTSLMLIFLFAAYVLLLKTDKLVPVLTGDLTIGILYTKVFLIDNQVYLSRSKEVST